MAEATAIRTAVIGLGKLGILHAGTLNILPNCRLVAVADKSKMVLNALQSNTQGIETYTEHLDLLDRARPDLVAIATPTELHVPIAIDCVRRGIPVLIEKPLSISAAQARGLLAALRETPVVNMVGYMTRFLHPFRRAKDFIAGGHLGKIQMVRASMYVGQLFKRGKGWRYDPKVSGGGVLMTQNSHLIDLLLWYFGEIDWASAHTAKLYSELVEDHVHAVFGFRAGFKGVLDASWSARHYRAPAMAVHVQGENGTLDVTDDEVRLYLVDATQGLQSGWHGFQKPDLYRGVPFDIGGTNYTDQAMQLIAALRSGGQVESDVQSAYRVQCVIDAAYRSAARQGAPEIVES